MKKFLIGSVIAIGVLTGCGEKAANLSSDLSEQPHSVEEYLANEQLTADTLAACKVSSEAEYREMEAKPACVNVREAEKQRDAAAAADFEAAFEKARAERRNRSAE